MDFFKGFIPTENKKCLMTFKGKTSSGLRTYEQVKNLPEFAGILADDTILVDIDDFEQSEILYRIVTEKNVRCRVYKTTRGKHFLFKNAGVETNKIHTKLAIGIDADIKLGSKNSYSILKFANKEREILYDSEEYDLLPKWLTPVKSRLDFMHMESGDGRNQNLFNYILTLQANDFSNDEARQTIEIINEFVLQESLEESELQTILRDEAFQKPMFFKKNTFLFDKFANYLKTNDYVTRINGVLHIYQDGIYVQGEAEIEAKMIEYVPDLNRAKRSEVMSYLDLLVRKNTNAENANFIAFKNGVYDISTGKLTDFSPDILITNKINHNYNPSAYDELVSKTFDKISCFDKNVRALLEETVGYCFFRRNELRKSFILTGDKKNGKSTFLAMLSNLLGEDNTSALDLKDLGERFSSASLFGKLANIGDDIGDDFITNPAMFKKVVSGDRVKGEDKGQKEFFFNPYCKLLFSANDIPRIKDKSGAVLDRLIIIPFDAQFSKEDPDFDPFIKYKLQSENAMEYLINLGLAGLMRVIENMAFTESEKVEKSINEYKETNNPIISFWNELEKDELLHESTKSAYTRYNEFCLANSFMPVSHIEFSKQVKKHFDYDIVNKSIHGKKYRVFVESVKR